MVEGIAVLVYLGLWVAMAAYLGYHAKGRGSRFWPWHIVGSLALGLIYVIAYGLHVKFSHTPESA